MKCMVPLPVARACGAVLSHSRERTKGRPVAAQSSKHHGCPRTPPRLAWGRNIMLREAIGFLAGAAWNGWGCYAIRPLAAGRHRWAALVARGLVGFWASLRSAGSLAHRLMCGAFFPTRGKEPKGDRWQPNRASTMAAPGPLAAWLEGGSSCCARLIASSRGRLGTPWGVVSVVRWRSGGTGGPPSLRAGWWALGTLVWHVGTGWERYGSL